MTHDPEGQADQAEKVPPSSSTAMLPFNPQDLVAMRVRPAQFARMCEVSKQSVSDWIRRGVISLGPDGLLDPVVASRQVFERTDPARLRARVFKGLARDVPELREQVRELRQGLKAMTAERDGLAADLAQAMKFRMHLDEVESRLQDLLAGIADQWPALALSAHAGNLPDDLERLACRLFRRFTADEMAEVFDDDPDAIENLEGKASHTPGINGI